jgi:hypothetical protein
MQFIGAVTAVRPQMLSVLLLALVVRRLLQPRRPWELPYLFGVAAVMANMHVYWVFIPALWALYRCAPRLLRTRAPSAAYAWGGLALLSSAALVSPYGASIHEEGQSVWMNYALVWEYLTMPPELKATIHEFKSGLAADGWIPLLLVGYVALLARTFRGRRFRADLPSGIAAMVGAGLAVSSLKFVAVFAVVSLPYVTRQAFALWRELRPPRLLSHGSWVESVAVAFLLAASAAHAARHFPWTAPNDEYIDTWQPVAACRSIVHLEMPPPRDARGHYRVLTHFDHGGWCRWAVWLEDPDADFRVTTDGRTQGVPPQHYFDAFDVGGVRNAGLRTLLRWNPDVIVLAKASALANVLRLMPDEYPVTFEDDNFVVYRPAR